MGIETIAHLSDLHIGRSSRFDRAAERLCSALLREQPDHVLVTGDVTHAGRSDELARFRRIFAPLASSSNLLVVPGNHDRLGDDAGRSFMRLRVDPIHIGQLYVVRVDSTGAQNRRWLSSNGTLTEHDLNAVDAALAGAPEGALTVVMLHHHPLPLPEDALAERISGMLGLPFTAELPNGRALVDRLRSRCDLVLHGHRHVPADLRVPGTAGRLLWVYNAGSSTELARARIFSLRDGCLLGAPRWLDIDGDAPELRALPAVALAGI